MSQSLKEAASMPTKPVPELPAWKAFVVQFSRETGTPAGIFAGRVEHLSSGRRARFHSQEELVAILEKLVGELCVTSDPERTEE
jgi:hypothetical protein